MDYLDDENQIDIEAEEQLAEELAAENGELEQEATETNTKSVAQFIALAGLATGLPFFIHLQLLTGLIINAILIIILFVVGYRAAVVTSLIPSIMAVAGGLVPMVLAPAMPFIMLSNIIFVTVIDLLFKRGKEDEKAYWQGMVVGAAAKFLFLYTLSLFVIKYLIKPGFVAKAVQMFGWVQFATALAGGIIAYAVLKFLKRI